MNQRIFNLKSKEGKRKKLRHETTKAEAMLWREIRNNQLGFKFRRQHGIGNYIVDFYCPEKKLVIEIDGDIHFYDKNIAQDKKREEYLKNLGLKIKRYTNLDILYNIENVLSDLRSYLNTEFTSPQPSPPRGEGEIKKRTAMDAPWKQRADNLPKLWQL